MRQVLSAMLALLAAACANLSPQTRDAAAVSQIVAGAVETLRSPAAERRRELVRAQRAFAEQPDDVARLYLATLLSTLPPPLQDDARAAALLEPLAGGAPQTPVARFAVLIAARVAERRRLAHAGERREDALRRQLEALKSIERGIQVREERLRMDAR